jgi:hypothetical protein
MRRGRNRVDDDIVVQQHVIVIFELKYRHFNHIELERYNHMHPGRLHHRGPVLGRRRYGHTAAL